MKHVILCGNGVMRWEQQTLRPDKQWTEKIGVNNTFFPSPTYTFYNMPNLRLGSIAPNFNAETTQ